MDWSQLEQRVCHENEKQRPENWFGIQKNWALTLVLPLGSWMALGKSLDLSEIQCNPLLMGIILIKMRSCGVQSIYSRKYKVLLLTLWLWLLPD